MPALIRRLTCPWIVTVRWDDLTATHRSPTFADALEWAGQYPTGSVATIRHRIGGIRAIRAA